MVRWIAVSFPGMMEEDSTTVSPRRSEIHLCSWAAMRARADIGSPWEPVQHTTTSAGFIEMLLASLRSDVELPWAEFEQRSRDYGRLRAAQGLPLDAITRQFHMHEYKGWDRENHFEWLAETLHRELQGQGPQTVAVVEKQVKATIQAIAEEGRYLTVRPQGGAELRLRITGDTDMDGAATDRSQLKVGMTFTAAYLVPQGFNAALGYDVMEMVVER